MSTRIPPLLQPYLSLPPETSLIVLTSVLGASTNWLVLRYLHSFLTTAKTPDSGNEDVVSVLLVSFLRDYPFWRDAAARSGVDLDGAGRNGRFVFVDGLTGLFLPPPSGAAAAEKKEAPPGWTVKLGSPRVEDVGRVLHSVVDGMLAAGGKVVMVLDQVDVLLATAGEEEGGMATRLGEVIMDLQEKTHATVMTLSADEPLVASQATTLEKEHAALVFSAAHQAEIVLGLRLLDTGTANDVSGVVRITRGGAESSRAIEEKEYLYHVLGDGGVRVFERGE